MIGLFYFIQKLIGRMCVAQAYNFELHLLELEFYLKGEKAKSKFYSHLHKNINIIYNVSTKEIYLYSGLKLYGKINFVPNNSLFTENLIKKTIENL